MESDIHLLSDEQMRQFIVQGYLLLKTDFSRHFHEQLVEQLSEVYAKEGNPGNNLLPRIPQLQHVFEHPVVKGALTSVLGPDYLMHAHRHGHYNSEPEPGHWHKDSYWGYKRMRNHRPWWAMIMYFPQDTPIELGPTGIMPGTQNYETRIFDADASVGEATAVGEAGTFVLIHFDIWHRSTANLLGRERFMLKFEFMRTEAPTEPSWDNRETEWAYLPAMGAQSPHAHQAMWRDAWYWLSGRAEDVATAGGEVVEGEVADLLEQLADEQCSRRTEAANRLSMLGNAAVLHGAVDALERALSDNYEPAALNAAYGLARMGETGSGALLRQLEQGAASVSRIAAYGLSAADASAVTGLIQSLASGREATAFHAAYALGEHAAAAQSEEVIRALTRLADNSSARLRCAAIDALGTIGAYRNRQGCSDTSGIEAMQLALQDTDAQVRFTAGLSLIKWGASAEGAVPQLVRALSDDNRYVRAHAADALYCVGSPKAIEALIEFLRASRWCPTTTKDSTFYP